MKITQFKLGNNCKLSSLNLLEQEKPGEQLFAEVGRVLQGSGMKLHIAVDSQSGLAHSAVITPTNVHDKHPLPDLLHGQERRALW